MASGIRGGKANHERTAEMKREQEEEFSLEKKGKRDAFVLVETYRQRRNRAKRDGS